MHRVASIDALETLYAAPLATTLGKETAVINHDYRQLIEAAPFVTVASVGPEGLDCSPRGDGPGFVRILDERTLALPDRRGNNRLDTLRNVVRDPRVALLFLIPGLNETLRINGRAHITTEPKLLGQFAVNGTLPVTVMVIEIDTMYFQCARALKRSRLWHADAKVDPKTLPSAGQLIRSVLDDFDAASYDGALEERQAKTLY